MIAFIASLGLPRSRGPCTYSHRTVASESVPLYYFLQFVFELTPFSFSSLATDFPFCSEQAHG